MVKKGKPITKASGEERDSTRGDSKDDRYIDRIQAGRETKQTESPPEKKEKS